MGAQDSRQRVRINTGIVLKQVYYTFIKDILESTLRNKLHVKIKNSPPKTGGLIEVLMVGCGAKPQFEEAKVLIGKTVKMTEENWKDLKEKATRNSKTEEMEPIYVEDSSCTEELLSDDEELDSSKENRKKLPKPTVVCGEISSDDDEELDSSKENRKKSLKPTVFCGEISSDNDEELDSSKENGKKSPKLTVVSGSPETDGICTVVLDTTGGPVSTNFSEAVYSKNKVNEKKNVIEISSCETNVASSDIRPTSSKQQTSNGSQGSEDFILIKSKKGNVQKDDTIVLDEETILISSDDDSEEDVLVDKVVKRMSEGFKKKHKKKQKRGISPIREAPLIKKKKRKSEDAVSLCQRSSKISKTSGQTDVTLSSKHSNSLPCNPSLQKKTKGKLSNKDQDNTPSTSGKHKFDDNVISSSKDTDERTGLRPIVIDSNNVARTGKVFHFKKLETCIKYFQQRGHKVIAFLPRHMTGAVHDDAERARLWMLEEQKVICFTPSRKISNGQRFAAYDDRFIVQTATELGGVIVSNDNFRDIMTENEKWKETIEQRLLMFTWVGDMLMFPNDPLGRDGPHLEEFLRFPAKAD